MSLSAVGPTDLRFSRARPYRARLRDATRRAKRAAEAAGQTNGRASAATASWPALDSSLEQRSETVRTVLFAIRGCCAVADFSRERGWMTAPYVGAGGGRLWRGAHECPLDV